MRMMGMTGFGRVAALMAASALAHMPGLIARTQTLAAEAAAAMPGRRKRRGGRGRYRSLATKAGRWTGAELRALRAERGVGQVRRINRDIPREYSTAKVQGA